MARSHKRLLWQGKTQRRFLSPASLGSSCGSTAAWPECRRPHESAKLVASGANQLARFASLCIGEEPNQSLEQAVASPMSSSWRN